ncbi:MAG TPA: hypothetical protein VGW12_13875 [Pyrinomonadaceae bacterium]|nr:hypothetical protein [Pyrinomonadaceae bacterium]
MIADLSLSLCSPKPGYWMAVAFNPLSQPIPSHGVVMDLPESQVDSFIVKLWTEAAGSGRARRVKWHGQITHVSDGARRSLKDLDEIKLFIEPYLAEMGVDVGRRWRLRNWIRRFSIHAARHE